MRRAIKSVLAVSCLLGIGMGSIPALAQMRGPRISSVRDVTCVANWERRFQMISPETWEMTMGPNDRDPSSSAKPVDPQDPSGFSPCTTGA